MEMAETFAADIVTRVIKSSRISKAFGSDKLSIFHMKNLGPRVYHSPPQPLCHQLSDPGYMEVFINHPIPKPCKDTSEGSSYRSISLLCPAAKVLETLILPTINKYLLPAPDQHGFRQEHSSTSALLQATTYIAMGFNPRKPPYRTVCVTVDLWAAFDTVCHNNLLSKINRSDLPPATSRWLSCYLIGRQVTV